MTPRSTPPRAAPTPSPPGYRSASSGTSRRCSRSGGLPTFRHTDCRSALTAVIVHPAVSPVKKGAGSTGARREQCLDRVRRAVHERGEHLRPGAERTVVRPAQVPLPEPPRGGSELLVLVGERAQDSLLAPDQPGRVEPRVRLGQPEPHSDTAGP